LRRQNVDLEALYSADEKMLRVLTQDEVLQALVDLAVDILEADKSAIFTQPAGQDKYCVRVWRGFRPETIQSSIFVHSQQEILATVAAGRRLILSDAVEDPKWRPPRSRIAELMDSQGFRSIMYMPIKVQDSVLGIFAVYCSTSPNTFDERRQRLFASLLQRAGLSIENSRLFEQTKQLAIVEERSRLAQDLHDSAKQKAFAALAQLGAAKKLANHDHGGAAEHLVEAENIVSDVIRDLTFFIQEFYPPNLKEKGLVAALQDYAFAWEARSGIQLNLSIIGGRSLPIQLEQVLYRIVQEGLSNIARHSQATVADLRIVYGETEIRIDIRDNGIGFDLPATPHGLGLQLIHERLESIGGRVEIETHKGGGTSLTIELPISEPA
jgi:signal transduction histidine kinase